MFSSIAVFYIFNSSDLFIVGLMFRSDDDRWLNSAEADTKASLCPCHTGC